MAARPGLIAGARALAAATLLWAAAAFPAAAQDPPPPDTLQRTLPDSLVQTLPDSAREVFGSPTRTEPQAFPARRYELRGSATEVFSCDHDCLRASSALSLLDLLGEFVPGLTPVRAGYLAGPHHLFEGPYGPGFVSLYVDGREIPSLERAQEDLRRMSLVYVERVRVFREAAGLIVDVDTYRHSGEAYSRIGGGTGQPRLQTLEGAFANGLSDAFTFTGGFELLDAGLPGSENDRFDALARLSWMPSSNDFGVQVEYRTETVDRIAADTADVRRNSLLLRARANLGERAQIELYGAKSDWKLNEGGTGLFVPDDGGGAGGMEGMEGMEEEEPPAPSRDADVLAARLSLGLGPGAGSLGAKLSSGGAYPSFEGDIRASVPVGPLALDGAIERSSWTGFSASAWSAAVAFSDTLVFPFSLRGFASSGDRGIGDPVLDTARVVGYSAAGAGGSLELGPYTVSGRYASQRLDRPVGLDATWDRLAAVDSSQVDITTWEARIDGPLIPLGAIIPGLEPIRLRGFYRSNEADDPLPLYVPDTALRGGLSLHDSFFDGNLQLWLNAFVERVGPRLVPVAGSTEPTAVSGYTWPGGQVMIKIGDFRFYYRFVNPGGQVVADIPGAEFPRTLGLFGIRWEFFN